MMRIIILHVFLVIVAFLGPAATSQHVYGDFEDADLKDVDEKYTAMSWRAMEQVNAELNDLFHWRPIRVLRARIQIVAGTKYVLDVLVAQSDCAKNEITTLSAEQCKVVPSGRKQICKVEIVEREWENVEEIKNRGCAAYVEKRAFGDRPRSGGVAAAAQQVRAGHAEARQLVINGQIRPRDYGAWNLFSTFIDRYNKSYTGKKEMLQRFRIYKRNLKAVKMWQENEQGTAEYGETVFSDMTPAEFRKIMLPYKWGPPAFPIKKAEMDSLLLNTAAPSMIDWRTRNAVTPVKNQGACGSCWAFSVTGNIEGQWAINKGKLVSLSEQELVDCDIIDQGCNGGLPVNAYKEIIRMGGLEPESDYPYEARGETCHLVRQEIAVYINDSLQLPANETAIAAYLAAYGPISIGINANPLMFYRRGIAHPWKILCSPKHLDHGVLIVGYGVEGTKPFWIIKNSWGEGWGEAGYFRLFRGQNVCGVAEMATSAIVK